jgi:hypothetical protein
LIPDLVAFSMALNRKPTFGVDYKWISTLAKPIVKSQSK